MKIIEAISDTNIGGAGVLLVNRLKYTDKSKYNTTVLLPKGSRLVQKIENMGIECVELNIAGDKSFDVRAIIQFVHAIKKYKPDIINSHGCMSSRVAAKLCGVPIKICTRHCVFPISPKYKIFKCFLAPINNCLSNLFIAVADAAKQNLISLGIKENKIKVIVNGAEGLKKIDKLQKDRLLEFLKIPSDATILAFCARLEECKGHSWFLKALAELEHRGENCVALFIGDGSQRNILVKESRALGIEKAVRFIGFADDVSPYMNIAHININCSVGTETSSLALSEGMSIGLPAVVSDYGGNAYMVHDGINGFVCPCYDHITMAGRIQTLISNKRLYEYMSAEAYSRFCCELNAEAMTKKTNKLYDKLYGAYRTANK